MSFYENDYDDTGVETSVVDQYAAPNVSDDLHSDIPETQAEADRGLENTTAQADNILEGESIVQWDAEYDVQAETDAAVAAGETKPHPAKTVGEGGYDAQEGVKTTIVDKYAAPNVSDDLHSDIPETQAEADRGLENTTAQADNILEGESIVQWDAEYDVQAETDAAVAAGKTKPHPPETAGEEEEKE